MLGPRSHFLKPNTKITSRDLKRNCPVTVGEGVTTTGRAVTGGDRRGVNPSVRGPGIGFALREQTVISTAAPGARDFPIFLQRRKEIETFGSGSFISVQITLRLANPVAVSG